MAIILKYILGVGLFFPVINWFFLFNVQLWKIFGKKDVSGFNIPIIGPVFIDIWIIAENKPIWLLPIPWIADVGTFIYIIAAPTIARDWWSTSRFTKLFTLSGASENQKVLISFHSTGNYVLKKEWERGDTVGITGLGDLGQYEISEGMISIKSHLGFVRHLKSTDGINYEVEDLDSPEDYQLGGWALIKYDK